MISVFLAMFDFQILGFQLCQCHIRRCGQAKIKIQHWDSFRNKRRMELMIFSNTLSRLYSLSSLRGSFSSAVAEGSAASVDSGAAGVGAVPFPVPFGVVPFPLAFLVSSVLNVTSVNEGLILALSPIGLTSSPPFSNFLPFLTISGCFFSSSSIMASSLACTNFHCLRPKL